MYKFVSTDSNRIIKYCILLSLSPLWWRTLWLKALRFFIEFLRDADHYLYHENCSKNWSSTLRKLNVNSMVVPNYCMWSTHQLSLSACALVNYQKPTHKALSSTQTTGGKFKWSGAEWGGRLRYTWWKQHSERQAEDCVHTHTDRAQKQTIVYRQLELQNSYR